MLFAVITCVSASRSFARAAASSALTPSSPIHGSSHASGAECSEMRICRRKRDTNPGVSGGCAVRNSFNACELFEVVLSITRAAHRSASSTSSSRCVVRSAMRRTLSMSAMRSMAGTAQSSPIVSCVTSWNAAMNSSTLALSMRASVWLISVIAISYTRG